MAYIKPRDLIECVKKFPVLYDQAEEEYRNADYKEHIWKKIAKELNVEGQTEECKKKWNGIRDSLRRARQKRRTKSGQMATSTGRYRFEAHLNFLVPHLAQRKSLKKVPDKEDENDAIIQHINDSHQMNSIQESQQLPENIIGDEYEEMSMPLSAKRRRKFPTEMKSQESAKSQPMAYLLDEKEAEKSQAQNQTDEQHHVDIFLAGIALSLKSLDPIRLLQVKGKIFNLVQEYELQQLRENSNQLNTLGCTSIAPSDTMSITFAEDEGLYTDEPSNFFSSGQQTLKSPNTIKDEHQ
ncbi:uncharacterized protein [Diabrotica undecimpunctata]|uniref:uncharacterized protein isoform X2 n=1 Tax=Diabrotica undecimpunctata TaxID=50387 RepID=UPI003B632BBF